MPKSNIPLECLPLFPFDAADQVRSGLRTIYEGCANAVSIKSWGDLVEAAPLLAASEPDSFLGNDHSHGTPCPIECLPLFTLGPDGKPERDGVEALYAQTTAESWVELIYWLACGRPRV